MKKKKKNLLRSILFPLALGLFGAALGYGLASFFGDNESSNVPLYFKFMLIPALVLALFLVIALHELGHVMAGLGVGFEFRMYTVGPFMIEKEAGKLIFKWNKNLNTFGGLALCLPKSTEKIVPKFIRFAAGGPLSSFVWALLAFFIFWQIDQIENPSLGVYFLNTFFILNALFSFMIFLVTAIPMRSGGFYTDGARVLNLSRGGYPAKLEALLLQTMAQTFAGMRPREMNPQALLEAIEFPIESPFKMYLHSFLYQHWMDKGELEAAAKHLEMYSQHIDEIPGGYQASVWLEKSYFTARHEQNPVLAREYFEKAKIGAAIPKSLVLRAEAALAQVEEKPKIALEKAQKALLELPKAMDQGMAKLEKVWLEEMIQELSSLEKNQ